MEREEKIKLILNRIKNDILEENKYFEKLKESDDFRGNTLASGFPTIVLFICECLEVNDIEVNRALKIYFQEMIENVSKRREFLFEMGSFLFGFSGIEYVADRLNVKKIETEDIKLELNKMVEKSFRAKINLVEKNIEQGKVRYSDYDCILGVTSVLRYLLEYKDYRNNNELIIKGAEYLIRLTELKEYKGVRIPKYHIKNEEIIDDVEKKQYKDGVVNFSVSHGIAGIMVTLGLIKENGIRVDGIEEAINRLMQEFIEYRHHDEVAKSIYWPAMLDGQSYIRKRKNENLSKKDTWCYGTPGIARALYLTGKIMKETNVEKIGLDALIKLAEKDVNCYKLNLGIVCHGYSGLLMIFLEMYRETGMSLFKKRSEEIVDEIIKCFEEESIFGFYDKVSNLNGAEMKIYNKINILEGTLGIGLALHDYLYESGDIKKYLLIK
ncbi:MAG: lanthionine synthetase C family protein [Clostridium sp.]|uniref:lanthionine synthetase C family protein n=1 Tax=Clostridium sp. TaxID=1506 RepID=UPI003EE61F69